MPWIGPFVLRTLLENCMDDGQEWPQANKGVYVVSQKKWVDEPKKTSGVLYVGSSGENSNRFCTRIGDLVADMLGFYDGGTGHHSGGQTLYNWCKKKEVHPLDLYIGWKNRVRCVRCKEGDLFKKFRGNGDSPTLLNTKRPYRCKEHQR